MKLLDKEISSMENLSDNELIKMAKSGKTEALDFLLSRYKSLASKIARSYFLVGAEYEDLLQEAMMGLYGAYVKYDENSKSTFSTFAHLCIERNVQSAVKMANRKKHKMLTDSISLSNQGAIEMKSEDSDEVVSLILPSSILSPDEQLIENEKFEEIKQKINKNLSKMEKNVLFLFLKGESYTQIAKILNIQNKSVDNALTRIRTKLEFLK